MGSELAGNGGSVVGKGVVGRVGNADFGNDGIDGNGGNVALGRVGAFGSVGKGFEGRGGNVALGSVGSELTGNGGSVAGKGVVGAVGNADFGKDGITGGRVGLVGGVGNGVDGNGGKVAFGIVG